MGRSATGILFSGISQSLEAWKRNRGGGLGVLTRHQTSPTFRDQIERLSSKYPAAVWHEYEPILTIFRAQSIISTEPKSFFRLALISFPRVQQA